MALDISNMHGVQCKAKHIHVFDNKYHMLTLWCLKIEYKSLTISVEHVLLTWNTYYFFSVWGNWIEGV